MTPQTNKDAWPFSAATYRDKVLGGWVGKCAGGILGAPIEGYKVFNDIALSDDLFKNNFANDDLDLQVLWLDMVSKKGPYVRAADFTEHWSRHVAFPWNEYGIASRNIALGLDNPDTGHHNNWYWHESMGSPIRSEIWGMLFPGQPERAAAYAKLDSELDHTGFSVAAEQFFSACAALAFVETDVRAILQRALEFVPPAGDCHALVRRVMGWHADHGFALTAAKIKSYYGDADFTSAPMNIGFTVLSLLHAAEDFDRIIESLHLGHDSDCVVATAGALLGTINGNANLPEEWKRRVGNELLISPEVSGIRCPATLTELADWTCEVGSKIAHGWPVPENPIAFRAKVDRFPGPSDDGPLAVTLVFENLTEQDVEATVTVTSPHFPEAVHPLELASAEIAHLPLSQQLSPFPAGQAEPAYRYTVAVAAAGGVYRYERGVPNYGEWLLLGPFIRDDRSLAPLDPDYPDHGMSSLPSVRYMNHDRINDEAAEFVDHATIQSLLDGGDRDRQPYGVAPVRPASMTVDLGTYFRGRGERTLYLTTQIQTSNARRLWLCLGCSGYVTAWLNGERILHVRELRRRWPASHVAEMVLCAGENTLTIRVDTVLDDYRLDIGLKDHDGRHHHQSAWNTTLVCSVPPAPAP